MKFTLPLAAAFITLAATAISPAHAVDNRVAAACVGDYLSYCSSHDPDGPGVRKCFRANGAHLSDRCVKALVAAGEVAKSEVARKTTGR